MLAHARACPRACCLLLGSTATTGCPARSARTSDGSSTRRRGCQRDNMLVCCFAPRVLSPSCGTSHDSRCHPRKCPATGLAHSRRCHVEPRTNAPPRTPRNASRPGITTQMRRAASALLGRPGRGKDAVTWWKDWPDTQVAPRTCRRLATAAAPDARELGALPVRLCPTACCVSEPPILACVWSSDVCAFCSVSKQWPTKLEEVTPEWLTAQLQRAGVVPAGAAVR